MTKLTRLLLAPVLILVLSGCSIFDQAMENLETTLDGLSKEDYSFEYEGGSGGGSGDGSGEETTTVRIPQTTTYYNGYAGLTITAPQGWYMEQPVHNLTESPAESAALSSLYSHDYYDGGYMVNLIYLENLEDVGHDDYAAMWVYMEAYYGTFGDLGDYLEYNLNYWTDNDNGYIYTLLDWETVTLHGTNFERIAFQVDHSENSIPYFHDIYVTPVGDPEDEVYLLARTTYWDDSVKGKRDAAFLVDSCFEVEDALDYALDHPSGDELKEYGTPMPVI